MRSRFDNSHSCDKWDKLRLQTNFIFPSEEEGEFIRCPYCGDPLDKEMKCYVDIELDTLHYKEKRLDVFVRTILKSYGLIKDILKSDGGIYLVRLECRGDGDKIAKSLCNGHWEVKSAHDIRHDRWTLN